MIILILLFLISLYFRKNIFKQQKPSINNKDHSKKKKVIFFLGAIKYRIFITYLNRLGANISTFFEWKEKQRKQIKENEDKFPKDNGNFD